MKTLVCGAGIAGLTLAYWLLEAGIEPVVVEKTPDLRTNGYMIDFAGSGCDVAAWMHLEDQLQHFDAGLSQLLYHHADGRIAARLDLHRLYAAARISGKFYSLDRRDLVKSLYAAVEGRCDVRFGDSPLCIEQDDQGITVDFASGASERFALVFGADGIHSQTRKITFGDESNFAHDLGYQVAIFMLPSLRTELVGNVHLYIEPDLQAGVYPLDAERWMVFLTYRADGPVSAGDRHLALKREVADAGWLVPEILSHVNAETPIFMDTVTQIQMPTWSRGRVALVGDAAYCPTLISGQGASMAMAGAYLLAQALKTEEDHGAAFSRFETWLRPHITQIQAQARAFAPTFVPRSRLRVFLTHWAIRLIDNPLVGRIVGKQVSLESIFDRADLPRGR